MHEKMDINKENEKILSKNFKENENSYSNNSSSNHNSLITFEEVFNSKECGDQFGVENDLNCSRLREDHNYDGFDNNLGSTWIYPINKPIRTYQLNMAKSALFRNTLVVLPTGLGKTFIAAVVMYNIYRWYPKGKIVYMAPTRPLVTQQIDACCMIMGIPKEDIAEMTGKTIKSNRRYQWHSKRIFFATPQVVQIDLNDPEVNFPFKDIKLVVIDEAHKAKGKFAYVEVVQSIHKRNLNFRILALSATPGKNISDVIEIIQNLLISNIEIRYENSIDVVQYTHRKNIKTIVIPLGNDLTSLRNELIDLIDPYLRNLIEEEVISSNITNMSKGWLIMEQKRFRERSMHQRHINHSKVATNFSVCISLYHALELLERHGARVLINYFEEDETTKDKFFVNTDYKIKKFVEKLRKRKGKNPLKYNDNPMPDGTVQEMPHDLDFGHPKFEKAREILLQHFQDKPDSRSIIFCEFRESVMLLHRLLLQNRPVIRPRCFVGQGGTGSIRAVTQNQQMTIMKEFREGKSNTLIATSVAEEGLDIGEVDIIICFDISTKNPTRFVQRIGRTGRIRHGQVIVLSTEGKEHSTIKDVLANKDKTNLKLVKSREIKKVFYKRSPRLVPPEFDPKCVEVFMKEKIGEEKHLENLKKNIKSKNKIENQNVKNKSKIIQKTDVRSYFKKLKPDFLIEEKEIFESIKLDDCEEISVISNEDLITTNELSKDYVVSQFDVTQYDKEVHNTTRVRDIENTYKKINHMARHLDEKEIFIDYAKNIDKTLRDKNISLVLKKYLLQKNVHYVKDNFDAMKTIWSMNKENTNKSNIVNEENAKQVKETYQLIQNVLGDRNEIEKFIETSEERQRHFKEFKQFNTQLKNDINDFFKKFEKRKDSESNSFEKYFNEIINLFKGDQFCAMDISSVSKNQNVTNQSVLNETNKSTSLYDSDQELDLSEIDSKYSNQWNNFRNINITSQSTPKPNEFKRKQDKNRLTGENLQSVFAIDFKETAKKKLEIIDHHNFLIKDEVTPIIEPMKNISIQAHCKDIKEKEFRTAKEYEISCDLFDDDFDQILVQTEHIINEKYGTQSSESKNKSNNLTVKKIPTNSSNIGLDHEIIEEQNCLKSSYSDILITKLAGNFEEKQSNNKKLCEKNRKDGSINTLSEALIASNDSEQSMMEVSEILNIVGKKESISLEKTNNSKDEIEDFDLNDFVEPFEEEEMYISSPDQLKNVSFNYSSVDEKSLEKLNQKFCKSESPISNNTLEHTLCDNQINKTTKNVKIVSQDDKNQQLKCFLEVSPSLIKRSTSLTKLKNINNHNESAKSMDESPIRKATKKLRAILTSSDSESENIADKEILEIKNSSQALIKVTPNLKYKSAKVRKKIRAMKRLKNCDFIIQEAEHSCPESENDEVSDLNDFYDSIVVADDTIENHIDSNLYIKYIETTKSPQRVINGRFKLPPPRKYFDMSRILSQPVDQNNSLDCYSGSFVASDEEVIASESDELSPLSKAEAILKERKKKKRKKEFNNKRELKRRRILNDIVEISDDEDK